ncbi:MAG: hypothetical protein HN357_11455 [Chloroflexi bacterium]|jgi:hypothetical protein|nr:hypothetical protein [Chloroflexota bacterium]MBT4841942.1 hypothetical protein [Anaerolineae bacterium]MBT4533817.1 hypothetical protein [Chloroflexota bacterium]MBT6062610.1 hypothetical protein [Anaerolineae bacterium]MBT6321205.1 hypothetical protein [Anaerolineae bacterium]
MVLSITGMHRSGTSLVASWLNLCGLILDQGRVIPPLIGNKKGFFEDLDFVLLQEKSIMQQIPFSGGWKVTSSQELQFSKSETKIAKEIISLRQDQLDCDWGWKDPRTCLFLHQWKELIPDLKTIIVWRPCDQVVHSLIRRWTRKISRKLILDPIWAIRVWNAYNYSALNYALCFPKDVIIVPLERLLSNDQAILDYVNDRFRLSLSHKSIQTVYEQEMLEQNPPGYLREICSLLGNKKIEDRLLSWSPI